MANQSFDTTIIRERQQPRSRDIDALQSQLNRAIRDLAAAQYAFAPSLSAPQTGFFGYGFKAQPISGIVGVELLPGMGFQFDDTDDPTAIDSVTGLNDLSSYKPLVLSTARQFTTIEASAGNCRRDRLMVKYNRNLMDYSSRYELNGSNVFAPVNVYNTLTFDLADPAVASVAYLTASAVLLSGYSFVYRKGNEVAYVDEDSFLSAPIPAEDAGYMTVAVINVGNGITEFTTGRIVDSRKIILPDGMTTVSASVQFTETLATFLNLRKAVPASWNLVAYKNDGSTGQDINFCIFHNDSDATQYVNVAANLFPVVAYPSTSPRDVSDLYSVSGPLSVTKSVQEIINGTTAGYTVLGGFNVAVGAKYLGVTVRCGKIGPQSTGTPGDFGFDAQALAVSASVYNLNLTANFQRTA